MLLLKFLAVWFTLGEPNQHHWLSVVHATDSQGFSPTGRSGPNEAEIEVAEQFNQNLKPFLEQIRNMNKLQFGDRCDYSLEESRQDLGKAFLNSIASFPQLHGQGQVHQTDINSRVLQNFKSLSNLRGDLCSVFDNLLCNNSNHCACAVTNFDHGVNIQFVREDNLCVLPRNAPCLPQNSDRGYTPYATPTSTGHQITTCSTKAPCTTKSARKPCTPEYADQEIAAIMTLAQEKGTAEREEFVARKVHEGVCTCGSMALAAMSFSAFFITALATNHFQTLVL